jgi:2-polyprenyl-3-methyl-5-hydroxy-6-metoxy-1,4-benzoquinol methylase
MAQHQTPASANPAEAYERLFVPALAAPWAEDLLGWAAPQPGERVLDVACGTGIVARLAAPRVGPAGVVVGVDPNSGMLRVARVAAAGEGVAIDWRGGAAKPCRSTTRRSTSSAASRGCSSSRTGPPASARCAARSRRPTGSR